MTCSGIDLRILLGGLQRDSTVSNNLLYSLLMLNYAISLFPSLEYTNWGCTIEYKALNPDKKKNYTNGLKFFRYKKEKNEAG